MGRPCGCRTASGKYEAPRPLGFFETLNPFERGGIWGALVDGARYDHCIDERRAAKRLFLAESG